MTRRLSWEDFNQTNLDDLFVRVFANSDSSELFILFSVFVDIFNIMLGAAVDH